MRNTQQIGCFGFLALCLAVYFLWMAILYAGIPIAVIGGIAAIWMFKSHPSDDAHDSDWRFAAAALGGGSAVLLCVSLAGNIFSTDGPFSKASKGTTSQAAAVAEAKLISICTLAISAPANDEFGIGAHMNGRYDSSSVTPNADGTVSVRLVHRVDTAGQCPSKLVGSCTMRGERVIRQTDLRQQGYFAC